MGALCSRRAPSTAPTHRVAVVEGRGGATSSTTPVVPQSHFCSKCGKHATTRCGKCKIDWYCSRDCQAAHWKVHKEQCNALASRNAGSASTNSNDPPSVSRTPLCGEGFLGWLKARGNHGVGSNSSCKLFDYLPEEPFVGFDNRTNNCYLNAVFQCLLHTPLLWHHLLSACPNPEDPWLSEILGLYRLVDEAKKKGESYVDPPRGVNRLIAEESDEFAFGRQADAHEALMLLITKWLEGCLNAGDGTRTDGNKLSYIEREKLEVSSLAGHVFAMKMGQKIACKNCPYESLSERAEYCSCLSITSGMTDQELKKCSEESAEQLRLWSSYRHLGSSSSGGALESSASPTSLKDLLTRYTSEELIKDFRCEKCKEIGGVHRTAYFRRGPNVLIIYVDRRQDTQMFGKINRRVTFEEELDLGAWITADDREAEFHRKTSNGTLPGAPALYHLYGIVVHYDLRGSTASGHYVAYVRDRRGRWYHVDDSVVRPVPFDEVKKQHAYVLFYASDVVLPPVVMSDPEKDKKAAKPKGKAKGKSTESSPKAPPSSCTSSTNGSASDGAVTSSGGEETGSSSESLSVTKPSEAEMRSAAAEMLRSATASGRLAATLKESEELARSRQSKEQGAPLRDISNC